MRKARVVIQPQAANDIAQHVAWIESEGSPEGALRWLVAVESAIESLRSYPERCGLAAEAETVGVEVRQLLLGSHRILFVIEKSEVHVLTVRHGARRSIELGPDTRIRD